MIDSAGEPTNEPAAQPDAPGASEAPEVITLDATVAFDDGRLAITFDGPEDCRDAWMNIFGGSGREGYGYTVPLLEAG